MLCCFSGTTYDIITYLICIIQKHEYLQNEKRYAKNENAILLYSEKPFKQAAIIFYFISTLNGDVLVLYQAIGNTANENIGKLLSTLQYYIYLAQHI